MTADQIVAQLKRWGITPNGYKSWSTHNREGHGAWGPVHGLVIHHTGSDGDDQRDYLYDGDAKLPGPLCHFHINKAGQLWLIGWGRANHAGGGDPNVLSHVINEDYTGVLTPHEHQGSSGSVDGNARFYGVEIGYSGTHEMTPAQYATLLKLCAAVAEHHKWTEKSFIAHGEWSDWKWDPGCGPNEKRYNMVGVRGDIKNTISVGPGGIKVPSQPSNVDKPDTPTQTTKDVWSNDSLIPPKGHATKENPTWQADSIVRFAAEQAEAANKKLDKIMKHLDIS
ncbi:peptidoglycan recognition protein family protein [Streptomyces anandii]|uniref:peptidoglycan recognition protein family protein n=1 Tax=Streptomyces anandii TaxID=285454 RepID=UPI0036976723